jgi:alpha-amylase
VAAEAPALAQAGVTELWLPPPTKAFERGNPGYAIYDLWDLGEFDQKGSVRTKYGTRRNWTRRSPLLTRPACSSTWMWCLTTRPGLMRPSGCPNTGRPRQQDIDLGPDRDIDAWVVFRFDGRSGQYSTMQWNASHFDSVDYDNITHQQQIFRISDKHFETVISPTTTTF